MWLFPWATLWSGRAEVIDTQGRVFAFTAGGRGRWREGRWNKGGACGEGGGGGSWLVVIIIVVATAAIIKYVELQVSLLPLPLPLPLPLCASTFACQRRHTWCGSISLIWGMKPSCPSYPIGHDIAHKVIVRKPNIFELRRFGFVLIRWSAHWIMMVKQGKHTLMYER